MSQATTTVPLSTDEAGVLRVAGTRVSLDSVIHAFDEGATAEEIAQAFPTLDLAAIYSVIGYYLQNRAEVEQYLEQRKIERGELKKEIEERFNPHGLRERLLTRKR
ncbi:MAG: DUF433 domain-containing protein [Acidobacteriota bacterium]|nr:DUF433 domain-containing protein [Acidobacteriota bacterium]MDQ5835690.1 DUF433 domain-containing protein [Acidobacteriota bacterium]